jgi:hypothetical protein
MSQSQWTPRSTALRMVVSAATAVLTAWTAGLHAQDIQISAPAEAVVGREVEVSFTAPPNPREFITIVAAGAPAGKYDAYQYARQSPVKLTAPVHPGQYEVRYLAADSPYPTLASRALTVVDATASLDAPASVDAGASLDVAWTGPDNKQDFISIVPAGTPEGKYERGYVYTNRGSPAKLRAPDAPGPYEIRYLMGQAPYRTLGSRPLTVGNTNAGIEAPAAVTAGSRVSFTWTGPDNAQDFITIVPKNAPDQDYGRYVYTNAGSPAEMLAPEVAGEYEFRYLTGQSNLVLARAPFTVTPVTASVRGPATVEALSATTVTWEGPNNPQDYVIIQPAGSENTARGPYAYTHRGTELRIQTPAEPGAYEYRYLTGQTNQVLASQPVTVVPRPVPGRLRVVDGSGVAAPAAAATVTVVLDASGSMLQRIDGEPRIAIAKASLTDLIRNDLPDGVGFSLHVFGHKEADSCRTDVEIPLGPLNRSEAAARVASINAMNLARTPIAATLAKAGAELAGKSGAHLLILLTDGEETCDGDPAAVIASLSAGGLDVRVNIVGFAIDELMLRETFQEWASLGNGTYLDARNAEELTAGLAYAIEVPFEVLDGGGDVVASGVVNGPAVELQPGAYRVRMAAGDARDVAVKADEEAVINLME